jgi:hypothetical protein
MKLARKVDDVTGKEVWEVQLSLRSIGTSFLDIVLFA